MAVGVAISGGGHRDALWGWGALLALAEGGTSSEVVSIASLSGGSIASGVVPTEATTRRWNPTTSNGSDPREVTAARLGDR